VDVTLSNRFLGRPPLAKTAQTMTLPFLQLLALVLLAAMMLWVQGQQSVLPPDQHAALMAVYDATGLARKILAFPDNCSFTRRVLGDELCSISGECGLS